MVALYRSRSRRPTSAAIESAGAAAGSSAGAARAGAVDSPASATLSSTAARGFQRRMPDPRHRQLYESKARSRVRASIGSLARRLARHRGGCAPALAADDQETGEHGEAASDEARIERLAEQPDREADADQRRQEREHAEPRGEVSAQQPEPGQELAKDTTTAWKAKCAASAGVSSKAS